MKGLNKELKIEIRPIPNRKGIRDFSENLEYFSQAHIISPLVDPVTRKYKTGLTEEEVEELKNNNFPYDISDTYVLGKSHEFWESPLLQVSLVNNPMFLFPGKNDIDFIKYKYLLQSKFVYSSEEEMKEGGKPEATHFIYNESDAIAFKASKIEAENKVRMDINKLSKQKRKEYILILLNENTDNKDDDYLTVRFEDIISNKHLYEELVTLLSKPKEEISLIALVKLAIQKNVLKRTNSGIFYFDSNLGFTENEVVETLNKPENQELYITIKSKIN